MASKKVIAMVILDDGEVEAKFLDPETFKAGAKKVVDLLKANPVSTLFTKYGTAAMVDICQAAASSSACARQPCHRESPPDRVGVEDPRGAPASCFLPVPRSVSSAGSSPAGSWRS